MKTAYKIFFTALSVIILSWFLPWLYNIILPEGGNDPFVAYSPVTDTFIISDSGSDSIYTVDSDGQRGSVNYTKEERDSLLPQIYYNQLMAHERFPDSINGKEVSVPIFKHNQWVFTSLPRDINKVQPKVYLMMESMPARVDLEDPKEVFRIDGDGVEFIEIATNSVNGKRSKRFTDIFSSRGFEYPMRAFSANVTTRKAYDEGYLMVDNKGDIYHVKMQAGRPYMVKVNKPDSIEAAHPFIMENMETRHLGLISDTDHNLYALEHEGYRLKQLPVGKVDPEKQKISIVKNLFNWVVKISDNTGSRWVALDSDDYSLLSVYEVRYTTGTRELLAGYIFPFSLSFTKIEDCLAFPRIEDISWHSVFLNILLSLLLAFILRRNSVEDRAVRCVLTLFFGIFIFLPFILIKN